MFCLYNSDRLVIGGFVDLINSKSEEVIKKQEPLFLPCLSLNAVTEFENYGKGLVGQDLTSISQILDAPEKNIGKRALISEMII